MEVTVSCAMKHEQPVLEHLMELYLHDFSEFEPLEIGEDGVFRYAYLPHYWEDPNRHPFLIKLNGKLAGFALLRFEIDPANGLGQMDMTEFFVLRRYRRQKVGSQAAIMLWDAFPGQWQVKVLKSNKKAYPFWEKIISDYTDNRYQEKQGEGPGDRVTVFYFQSVSDGNLPGTIDNNAPTPGC